MKEREDAGITREEKESEGKRRPKNDQRYKDDELVREGKRRGSKTT